MNRPLSETLGYAAPTTEAGVRTSAILSMVVGLCSGPASFAVIALLYWERGTSFGFATTGGFVPLFWALLFTTTVADRRPAHASSREAVFTAIGFVAPIIWLLMLFGLVAFG